jgi:hypothetical protein
LLHSNFQRIYKLNLISKEIHENQSQYICDRERRKSHEILNL